MKEPEVHEPMSSAGLLAGRTALVTGSGGGIGRGIALAFAAAGAQVIIAARRALTGDEVAREIVAAGGKALSVQTDVSRRSEVEAAVARAVEAYGGLDILVHNASSGRSPEPAMLENVTDELWDAHASVAVRAAFHCAQAAFPHFRARGGGRYILLTSTVALQGSAYLPVYAAVKNAQRGFVKALAREWGPLGIHVNAIAPAAETPAVTRYFEQNPQLRAGAIARLPLRRMGEPRADIGAAAVFLAGDGGRFITGQTLVVDGGNYTCL
jgi:3-oxoacyl-[acyl-carrier protein] reductase